jgi:hypothetical protein
VETVGKAESERSEENAKSKKDKNTKRQKNENPPTGAQPALVEENGLKETWGALRLDSLLFHAF